MQRPEPRPLEFRDPEAGGKLRRALAKVFEDIGRPSVALMHVCGTHEQAIARYGLRAALPPGLEIIMGPGCPVCVTHIHEVDEGVALARQGKRMLTYGDMLRVPGTRRSLEDARAEGSRVEVVYSVSQAVDIARDTDEEVVFFATGFETTAVATAAALLVGVPPNFSVLSAHKYVPPAMELVAGLPESRIEGFLAAGHAATITGWGLFEPLASRYGMPIVVGGFEPLDILAGLLSLAELVRDGRAEVVNAYPRCVTREGNRPAQAAMWKVFEPSVGNWRGIGEIPDGNLSLRDEWAHLDARRRYDIDTSELEAEGQRQVVDKCICGQVMVGMATPTACHLFGTACTPARPVGACMVSSEGTCRIWHEYGGHPDLGGTA
ncbi:MAG: hydrogenase formation protein HypD [Deltaproteobacteria bacterium]|nr:hydrogenase formation protein HypD [Deltaproteobacteria bacterium]